jgi:hypothetical protein
MSTDRSWSQYILWFAAFAVIAFFTGATLPRISAGATPLRISAGATLPRIAEWIRSQTSQTSQTLPSPSTFTKRVSVTYPESWAVNEYRNCVLTGGNDPISNLPQLSCDLPKDGQFVSSTPGSRIFVIDVKFSGYDKQEGWTCQNEGASIMCRSAFSEVPSAVVGRFLRNNGGEERSMPQPGSTLDEPRSGYLYIRISNGQLWVIPADKLQEARRLDPGLSEVDRRGF